jgi:hypothetical protein
LAVKFGVKANSTPPIAEGGAAGPIDKEPIERIAGAAAHRGEPIALGCATVTTAGVIGGAIEVRPVAISLDADHELAPLVIAAERAADEEAVRGSV